MRVAEPGSPVLDAAKRCYIDGRDYAIEQVRPMGDASMLVKLAGVEDRNGAEALRGLDVEVDRAEFPDTDPGEYYLADLIGLRAVDPDGKELGHVTGLVETGAAPLLTIEAHGREVLVPTSGPFVRRVDVANGVIEVEPPPESDDQAE